MDHARTYACPVLYRPEDAKYEERIRQFQGCPTLATTKGGRIYLGWYSGGTTEPHIENYNLLHYSDDNGKSWSKPLLVIPSNKELGIHALDIQLWTAPDGTLHVFWVQNNACPVPAPELIPERTPFRPVTINDGYLFADFTHACWETVCADPDAADPQFSEPRYLGTGFLRCKPVVLQSGAQLNFNYEQVDPRYAYSVSHDGGKTYERCYGAEKLSTPFDESMAYEKEDGSVRMFARTRLGELAESISCDGGKTWSEAQLSGIDAPNTRFFVSRTPSGRVLLIHNDDREDRKNMTLSLSEDDGKTWKYHLCIDTRNHISYPDADFYNGRIYLTYDRERTGAKEILFASVTEEDIIEGRVPELSIVSKP